jgi:hypothetical protein
MTNQPILDAAYQLAKKAHGPSGHADAKDKLQALFPLVLWGEIVESYLKGSELAEKCYEIGDAARQENIPDDRAIQMLKERFSGFSEETYRDALSRLLKNSFLPEKYAYSPMNLRVNFQIHDFFSILLDLDGSFPAKNEHTDTPTIAIVLPMKIKRWNSFSVISATRLEEEDTDTNASSLEAKQKFELWVPQHLDCTALFSKSGLNDNQCFN